MFSAVRQSEKNFEPELGLEFLVLLTLKNKTKQNENQNNNP